MYEEERETHSAAFHGHACIYVLLLYLSTVLKAGWRGVIGNPCFTVPQNKRAATGLVCCPAPSFSTPNKRGEKALDIRTCSHPAIVLALPSSQATHERLPSTTVQFVGRRVALRRAVMSRAKHQSSHLCVTSSSEWTYGHSKKR